MTHGLAVQQVPGMFTRIFGQGRVGFFSLSAETLRQRYALPASRWVRVAGTLTHYTDEGPADGDVLVLIHGFASSLHTWEGLMPSLTQRYRVIRMDIAPFGLTGPARDANGTILAMGIELYRDFIDGFLDAVGIVRATMIGSSLGGLIAWDFTLRHPGMVDKLVLIDSAGFPMKLPIYIDLFRHAWVRWSSPWMLPEFVIRAATRDVYGDRARVSESTYRRYVDFFYGSGAREAIGKMVPKLDFSELPTHLLGGIRAPTLVLWGERDRWIPPAHAEFFTQGIRGARLRLYAELGHIPMEEDPQRVAADLMPFLAEQMPGQ